MRWFLLVVLTALFGLNFYFHFFRPDPVTAAKINSFSLSRGQRYYQTLQLWYLLADSGDWHSASLLEPKLDPLDIKNYLSLNSPDELKKRQNTLIAQTDKNIEDWLELARIQVRLNRTISAINSLNQAKKLDPIRPDIDKMISELKN